MLCVESLQVGVGLTQGRMRPMRSAMSPRTQRGSAGDPVQQCRPLASGCWRQSMHAAPKLQRLVIAIVAGCIDTSHAAPAGAGL